MKRNWSLILIDAGIRDITVSELAQEIGAPSGQVTEACARFGITLRGQKTTGKTRDEARHPPSKPHKCSGVDWKAEFLIASQRNETLNEFCRRVTCGHGAAAKQARGASHVFAKAARHNKVGRLMASHAPGESLNAFCRRTGLSAYGAQRIADREGVTFAPSRSAAAKRMAKVADRKAHRA